LKHRLQKEAVFNLKVAPLGPRPPNRDDMIEAVRGVRQVTVSERTARRS